MAASERLPTVLHEALSALGKGEAHVVTEPRAPFQIVYVNSEWCDICGFSAQEALSRTPTMLQGPCTDRATLRQLKDAVAKCQTLTVDVTNYKKDGTPFVNRLTVTPLQDAGGELLYYLGIVREMGGDPAPKSVRGALPPKGDAPAAAPTGLAPQAAISAPEAAPPQQPSGRVPPFLTKLHMLMSDASTDDIAGWNEDGTAICVHKPAIFAKSLLPRYFKHNKCDAAAGLRICPPPPHPRMRHARSTGLDPSSSSSIFMTSNERPACRTSTRPLFGATRCSSAVKQIS